jgi:hypothetical protein
MSNAAVIAVLDEFDEIIHGLVGLYFDPQLASHL